MVKKVGWWWYNGWRFISFISWEVRK